MSANAQSGSITTEDEDAANPRVLQTFVQISDLHIGDIDANGDVRYDRFMKTMWTWCPFFGGLVCHHKEALTELMKFWNDPQRCDPASKLLVTGDLTSTAKASQFQRAETYITGFLPPPLDDLGLNTGAWIKLKEEETQFPKGDSHQAIPGNHDHWPGKWFLLWIFGGPTALMQSWQPTFPFVGPPIPLKDTEKKVRFLALNSDAAVSPWSRERALARGNFTSELDELEKKLKNLESDPNEIRILLIHHSVVYEAKDDDRFQAKTYIGKKWYALMSRLGQLEMNEASRRRLLRFLAIHDIPVVLTGHTHSPHVKKYYTLSLEKRRPVRYLEARCGTTTQTNVVPSKWPSLSKDRRLDENTLLVHQLVELPDKRIVWQTLTLERDPEFGFKRVEERGEPWDSEIVVWPLP